MWNKIDGARIHGASCASRAKVFASPVIVPGHVRRPTWPSDLSPCGLLWLLGWRCARGRRASDWLSWCAVVGRRPGSPPVSGPVSSTEFLQQGVGIGRSAPVTLGEVRGVVVLGSTRRKGWERSLAAWTAARLPRSGDGLRGLWRAEREGGIGMPSRRGRDEQAEPRVAAAGERPGLLLPGHGWVSSAASTSRSARRGADLGRAAARRPAPSPSAPVCGGQPWTACLAARRRR